MRVGRKFCLTQISGPNLRDGRAAPTVVLAPHEQVLGRSERCDHPIAVPTVSRTHAAVWATDEAAFVRDMGSGHGTFVNSEQVWADRGMRQGDLLALGTDAVFLVSVVESAELAALEGAQLAAEPTTESTLAELALADDPTGDSGSQGDALSKLLHQIAEEDSECQIVTFAIQTLEQHMHADRLIGYLGSGPDRLQVVTRRERALEAPGRWPEPSSSILRRGFFSAECVLSFDAKRDERFRKKKSVALSNVRSTACAPLLTSDGPIGVLYADALTQPGAHNRNDGQLLGLVGRMVGARIEVLRLKEAVTKARQQRSMGSVEDLDLLGAAINSHCTRLELAADDIESEHGLVPVARLLRAENERLREELTAQLNWARPSITAPMPLPESEVVVDPSGRPADPLGATQAMLPVTEPEEDEALSVSKELVLMFPGEAPQAEEEEPDLAPEFKPTKTRPLAAISEDLE